VIGNDLRSTAGAEAGRRHSRKPGPSGVSGTETWSVIEGPASPGLADGERTGRAGDHRDARDGAGSRSKIEYPEIYIRKYR